MRHKQRTMRAVIGDELAATTLEWALLMAALAIPSYWLFRLAMNILVDHYRMVTTLNALPLP